MFVEDEYVLDPVWAEVDQGSSIPLAPTLILF